jgi:GNAT superfamily N-acetyltransferase
MKFFIRDVIASDASAITRLSAQLGYTMNEQATRKAIQEITENKNDILFVAADERGGVAGWIHVFRTMRLESGSFCEIGGLVVDEACHKMGIGKMLVEKARSWCLEKNNDTLRVRCNVKRTDAHAFYLKLGFNENKQQKVFQTKLSQKQL